MHSQLVCQTLDSIGIQIEFIIDLDHFLQMANPPRFVTDVTLPSTKTMSVVVANFDSNEARITKTWKSYQLQGQRSASKSDLPSRISASGHEKRKHDKVFFSGG